jgi:hypothetical protein
MKNKLNWMNSKLLTHEYEKVNEYMEVVVKIDLCEDKIYIFVYKINT